MKTEHLGPAGALNRCCPVCKAETRLARAVSTIPGRVGIVCVTMICQICHHEWEEERQEDPATSIVPRATARE